MSKSNRYTKEQNAARQRLWRQANPEKQRQIKARAAKQRRYRRHGITLSDYLGMFAAQENRCKSCGTTDPRCKAGWHIDHDHQTNVIRGIVCQPCNMMAGFARDNPMHLRAVADYLERAT